MMGLRRLGGAVVRKLVFMLGKSRYAPPHKYKKNTVKKYAKKFHSNTFLETGTYRGDMDLGVYDLFEYLASVEIEPFLYEEAKKRLENYGKIHLYNGNSAELLPAMLEDIKAHYKEEKPKLLFWLDGHYSGGVTGRGEKDTPIMEELQRIRNSGIGECVILIDDARCFIHMGEFIDYPTIPFLKNYVKTMFENCKFTVRNDIIRIIVRN